jgi:DNA-binding response OmpR family regulator
MPATIEFPPFRLDLRAGELYRDGLPVRLRPKTFAVLQHLAERAGALVGKQALIDAVRWDVRDSGAANSRTALERRWHSSLKWPASRSATWSGAHGIGRATHFTWRSKYAGTSVSELKRMKELEAEKATLKRMYAVQ